MCCTKFILFTTNAIIFVLGVIVVGIASATVSRSNEYGDLLLNGVITLPVAIIIVGLIICIIGFLGCFGALKESKCMLYTYAVIVLALFIAEITIAVLIIANPEGSKEALGKVLESQFKKYDGPDESLTNSIDRMQKELQCCGVDSYEDWNNYWNKKNEAPWSCCHENENQGTCSFNKPIPSAKIYDVGCLDAVIDQFQDIIIAMGVAGIILAIFLFFSMSTACGLARKQQH